MWINYRCIFYYNEKGGTKMSKEIKKPEVTEKKVKDTASAGERFEDLNVEEMKKYQGSGNGDGDGDVKDITTITNLLSKNGYKC